MMIKLNGAGEKVMKITHQIFVDILKNLELPVYDGVCKGFGLMWAQFYCMGREQDFFSILSAIKKYRTPQELIKVLRNSQGSSNHPFFHHHSPSQKSTIPLPQFGHSPRLLKNFFEEMAHYQNPSCFEKLLRTDFFTQDIEKISELLSSRQQSVFVIPQMPLKLLYSKSFMLSKDELYSLLIELKKKLEECAETPLAILIGNDIHSFGIQYNTKTHRWTNRDINLLTYYEFCLNSPQMNIEHNKIYVEIKKQALHYKVINPLGVLVTDTIPLSAIKCPVKNLKDIKQLKNYTKKILSIISSRGHALIELEHYIELTYDTRQMVDSIFNSLFDEKAEHAGFSIQIAVKKELWIKNLIKSGHFDPLGSSLVHVAEQAYRLNSRQVNLLQIACFLKDAETIDLLLQEYPFDLNELLSPETGDNLLHFACITNHVSLVKVLLDDGRIDINGWNSRGQAALHIACENRNTEVIKLLLMNNDIAPNQWNEEHCTCLFNASYSNALEVMKILLANPDVDPNMVNGQDETSLGIASLMGHYESVMELLKHPATDPNISNKDGDDPLYWAFTNNDLRIAKVLLAHQKIDPNSVYPKLNCTLLHQSCRDGNEAFVKELLECEAINPYQVDKSGNNPYDDLDQWTDAIKNLLLEYANSNQRQLGK